MAKFKMKMMVDDAPGEKGEPRQEYVKTVETKRLTAMIQVVNFLHPTAMI
jgi:hypothetical protein